MAITGEHGTGHRTHNSASHNVGPEGGLAPHDPYRKLATAIIAQAVRDYTAPKPHDTGHKSVETRVKNWQINRMSADFFLFRDNEPQGKWAICCYLIRIAPDIARKDMIKKLKDNTLALDILSDK